MYKKVVLQFIHVVEESSSQEVKKLIKTLSFFKNFKAGLKKYATITIMMRR